MIFLWNGKHVPDKGWCWVMFICSCLISFSVCGVHYSYGTLYPHLLKEFNQGEGNTAWIGSISSGLLFFASLPSIWFYKRTSAATTCLVGALLSGSSLIMTSYVQDFRWLYLTYGCLFGIGTSLLFTPINIMLTKWFVKYRTLNIAMASSSGALGSIVLSTLIQYSIQNNGIRVTLKLIGICYLLITVLCSLSYRPLRDDEKDDGKELLQVQPLVQCSQHKSIIKNLLSNRSFIIYVLVMIATNFTYFIPITHLVYYALHTININEARATLLIPIWSISALIGKLVFGKIIGYYKKHTLRCYQMSMFLSGFVTVLTYFSNTYWLLVCYVVSYGFLDGSYIGLHSVVTLEIVGFENFDQGYGILLTSIGLPIAFGPPLVGFINDKRLLPPQSMFLIAGIPFILGSFLMIFVIRWKSLHVIDRTILLNLSGNDVNNNSTMKYPNTHILYISNV